MIRYLAGDSTDIIPVDGVDPTTTLLDYLRAKGRTGTKEGCASGDCGACTVVLAEPDPDNDAGLRYRAVNSCITLLPALHGRRLIDVQDLADGNALHPVQQALVDHHGSQCGFCTPGFVMALFAYAKRAAGARDDTPAAPETALSGNLCRCTGYRPILDAARQVAAWRAHGTDRFDTDAAATRAALDAVADAAAPALTLSGGGRSAYAPGDRAELRALLAAHPDARLYAGGTDFALEITQKLERPATLIYLGRVAELRGIDDAPDALCVGAAAPLCELAAALCRYYPCDELLERFGSPQIRNQGTLGGNLGSASPIGDLLPVLLALGADIVLDGAGGERVVAADDFFVGYRRNAAGPGEAIVSARIPKPAPGRVFRVYKISKRFDDDISAVCAAFSLSFDAAGAVADARIAYGGMAAVPQRARRLEAALRGRPLRLDDAVRAALAADFSPLSDARASAGYRLRVAANLVERLRLELTPTPPATRVRQIVA